MKTVLLMAAPVSQQETERIANFFFHEHGGRGDLHYLENSEFSHLHFYSGENGRGFVIMSADDCVLPILGYSACNELSLTDMGPNTRYWLEEYERQIEWNIKNNLEVNETVTETWRRLTQMIPQPQQARAAITSFNTANLLTTTWSQRPYYNSQCPYDSQEDEYTLTGCVATAMGQIMKYWEFPERGFGSHTYTDPYYGIQSADFSDTVFDYDAMPNKLNSYSTASQVNAVALLLRRCGIAVEMNYGVDGSGAVTTGNGELGIATAENAYREYFKFMHTLHSESLSDYTDSAWVALLKNEIDSGRPVQYSAGNEYTGGGHSFVCCGYDNTGKLYFNWGWNGSYDGYFQIGQLNPGSSYYNARNVAIIGIEPDTSGSSQTTITLVPNIQGAGTMYGAGTYTSYQDTVTMLATANAGYLFDRWDDNLHYNPYQFLANGGNITHTANFVKMTGDTLGYCHDANVNSYGGSSVSTRMWAIRLDSNSIAPRRELTHVQAYISEEGNYKVHIFQGATANSSTLVLSDTLNIPSSQDETWVDIELSTPVNVNRELPLWIALETRGSGYPKSYSAYMGNNDGAWSNGSNFNNPWDNYVTDFEIYLAWQIRGVFAEREMQNFEVTVVSDNTTMGTVTGGGTYPEDTTIIIKAIPNEGYHFVKWQDDNTDSVRMIVVNDNLSFTAFFEEDLQYFDVTVVSDNTTMGTVTGGGTYPEDTTIIIKAIPNEGYHFVKWQDDNTDSVRMIVVNDNLTFTAFFEEDELQYYEVTVVSDNTTMGTVTGGGTYPEDTTITIKAIPNEGYHFVKWQDDNTDSVRMIVVNDNLTFTAFFEEDELQYYEVTVVSDNTTMGTVTGGGTYPEDTTITIKAIPNDGYHFVKWQDDNTDSVRQIIVNDNLTFTAFFEEDEDVAVDNVSVDEIRTYTNGHHIIIENATGREIRVYDATGKLVASRRADSNHTVFNAITGVYFIRIDGETLKVVVK